MKKLFLLSLLLLSIQESSAALSNIFSKKPHKIVLSLPDGKVIELNKSTSCATSKIGDKNSCSCCLIKHTYDKPQLESKTAIKVLNYCLQKNYCEVSQLPSTIAPEDYINQLKTQYIRTVNIDTNPSQTLSEALQTGRFALKNDKLSESAVPDFLKLAAQQNLLPPLEKSLFLQRNSQITAKKLGEGGGQTGLLFGVSVENKSMPADPYGRKFQYILKETKKKSEEMRNLTQLKENKKLQEFDFLNPDHVPEDKYLLIAFEVAHLLYGEKEKKYFTLTNTAPGVTFSNYLSEVGKTQDFAAMGAALHSLGFKLANFHKFFMDFDTLRTFIHRDFHFQNLFIHPSLDIFTMIDVESMASTLKRKDNFADDVFMFYMVPMIYGGNLGVPEGITSSQWLASLEVFIEGYLLAYEGNQELQQRVYQRIKRTLYTDLASTIYNKRKIILSPKKMQYIKSKFAVVFKNLDQKFKGK